MKFKATNAHDAAMEVLSVIYNTDVKKYSYNRYGYVFVYFHIDECKFYFEKQQRKKAIGLIKRYKEPDMKEILSITAHKYPFSAILIAGIINRKLMDYREFFQIAKDNFDWMK